MEYTVSVGVPTNCIHTVIPSCISWYKHTYRYIYIYLNIYTHCLVKSLHLLILNDYLEILGYYTCSTIVHPLFVEHFQGQQAELIGYALGFWPSPTELGRNWHSATHKKLYLPWTGPDKGIESSNMHCLPRRKACFLELGRYCMWWAARLTLAKRGDSSSTHVTFQV